MHYYTDMTTTGPNLGGQSNRLNKQQPMDQCLLHHWSIHELCSVFVCLPFLACYAVTSLSSSCTWLFCIWVHRICLVKEKKEKNLEKNRLGDLKDILVTLCDNNI